MKRAFAILAMCFLFTVLIAAPLLAVERTEPIIIDHTCTDLSLVPAEYIEAVMNDYKMYYAHTSHGWQPVCGLQRIEAADPFYDFERGAFVLPNVAGAFCMYDDDVTDPNGYWRTAAGMNETRSVLAQHPSINTSMFGWCVEISGYPESEVQAYLDSMSVLETEHPDVTFIYMTGNAQAIGVGGLWRYENNNMIRQFCIDNNKVLYDFADLDCWWYNPSTEEWDHYLYEVQEQMVPAEHPQFYGTDCGHTAYTSCEQKGRAFWWMMARIAEWAGPVAVEESSWGTIKNLYK